MTPKEEWERFKTFDFSTKVQYIYDNYLAQLIVGAMVLVGVIIFGLSLWNHFHPDQNVVIGVIDYDGWMETLEEVDEDIQIGIYQGATYDTLVSGENQNVRYALASQISTGDLDGLVASPETILYLQAEKEDYFMDLSSVYTSGELAALEDRLLYKEDVDGERYPIAIDLTDSRIFEGGKTGTGIYFSYTVTTNKFEQLQGWLDKVLSGTDGEM